MLSSEDRPVRELLFFTNVKDSSFTVTRSNDVMVSQWTRSGFSLNPRGGTTVAASALEIVFYAGDSSDASIRRNKRSAGDVADGSHPENLGS